MKKNLLNSAKSMAMPAILSRIFIPQEQAVLHPLLGDHHTLPVFLQITSELNQSAWQTANSLHCSSDLKKELDHFKELDQSDSKPNRQPGVMVHLSLTFLIGKVDGLTSPSGFSAPAGPSITAALPQLLRLQCCCCCSGAQPGSLRLSAAAAAAAAPVRRRAAGG